MIITKYKQKPTWCRPMNGRMSEKETERESEREKKQEKTKQSSIWV